MYVDQENLFNLNAEPCGSALACLHLSIPCPSSVTETISKLVSPPSRLFLLHCEVTLCDGTLRVPANCFNGRRIYLRVGDIVTLSAHIRCRR